MAKVSKRRGRWVLDFRDQFGNRKWVTMPKGSTKKDAETRLRGIIQEVGSGVWMPETEMPRFHEVGQAWLEYKRPNVRETTWGMYELLLRLHFATLDPMRIKSISAKAIESFLADKQADGMNISTIRRIMTTLNQVLRYAARHRLIEYNPFTDVEKPKDNGCVKKSKALAILTPDQIGALLDATVSTKYKTLFRVAIFTGARQGEVLGLNWSDIDFEKRQIHIQRSFNNGKWFDVKTATSNRHIDIGPALSKVLKEWRLACPGSELNLIFPNNAGKPMNKNNMVNRHFTPALKAAGLEKMRFHDLRHTFASLLIAQGENPKYIQHQMGHSSIQVTFDIYGHLLDGGNKDSAKKLEEMVFKKSKPQSC